MSADVEDATTSSPSGTATQVVFRGNAAAFGGGSGPTTYFEMPGASSLPVVGGRSTRRSPDPRKVQGLPQFESASTFAEGKFDDRAQAIELTHGRVQEETLVTPTRVRAEINKLTVGTEKRLTVGRMVAELLSASPKGGSGEPSIPVGEVSITGLAIDGFRVRITFNSKPFIEHDTHARVLRGVASRAFVKQHGRQFFVGRGDCSRIAARFTRRWPPKSSGRASGIRGPRSSAITWSSSRTSAASSSAKC
jgi:hypothetical protein